jgi:hypothetical protein
MALVVWRYKLITLFLVVLCAAIVIWLLVGLRPMVERYLARRVSAAIGQYEEKMAFRAVRQYARWYAVIFLDEAQNEIPYREVDWQGEDVKCVKIVFDSGVTVVRRLEDPSNVIELLGE